MQSRFKNQKKKAKPKRSPSETKKMFRKQLLVGMALVLLISLLVFVVYKVSRVESWQITEVKVVGGETIPQASVEKMAREAFAGTYLSLIPRSFKPTFSEAKVEETIQSVDRIKNVKVELTDRRTVTVVYEEYHPVALWCKTLAEKNCLFLDSLGYAFAEAPALEGSAFVRFVDSAVEPKKYSMAFSPEFIASNEKFFNDTKEELGLFVTHVEKMGDYDVEYTVSGGGKIKTSQNIDLAKSFKNLRTVLQSDDFAHIEPGKFQYIDLRFGDKVFVNEEIGPVATTTSETSTNTTNIID